MFLLQTNYGASETGFIIVSFFVSLFIMYYVIKSAVQNANEELHEQLKLQNQLKTFELSKHFSSDEIQQQIDLVFKKAKK